MRIHFSKKIVKKFQRGLSVFLLAFSLIAVVPTGAAYAAPKTSTTTSTSISSITSGLSSITGSVNSIIAALSGITGIFDSILSSFNMSGVLGGIMGDNKLMKCIMGGLAKSGAFDGLCSMLDFGGGDGGGFDFGEFAQCIGIKMPSFLKGLGDICKSGSNGEIKVDPGDGGSGDYLPPDEGGDIDGEGGEKPNGKGYDPAAIAITESVMAEGVSDGSKGNEPKKVEDRKFPGGKTGAELYKDGGGYFIKMLKEKPNSSLAQAVRDIDIPTLVLKEKALQSIGSEKEKDTGLPPTKADALNQEDAVAQFITSAIVDHHSLGDNLAIKLREEFTKIKAENLTDYYKKEKEKFREFIDGNDDIKGLYNVVAKMVQTEYGNVMFAATQHPQYVHDPSEARVKLLPKQHQNAYRFAALHQMTRNMNIKIAMGEKMKREKILLDITLQRAYVSGSIFRSDIAKTEIEAMLKAVDQAIK